MLTLYYAPGACSLAAHIVLEESGEAYEARRVDFSKAEQRTEAYLKINPQGRVPALLLDNGEPLAENTAILPFLGKRFGLWPKDALGETRALSLVGFFASTVHPAHAHFQGPSDTPPTPHTFPIFTSRSQDIPSLPTSVWPDGSGCRKPTPCSIPTPSSSTPGACGASCRWWSSRTIRVIRSACSRDPPCAA